MQVGRFGNGWYMDRTCNMKQKLRLDKSFAESETQEEMKVGRKLGVTRIAWPRNSGLIMEFFAPNLIGIEWAQTHQFVIICPFAACVQRCDIFFSSFFVVHTFAANFTTRWQVCHILWSEQRIRGRCLKVFLNWPMGQFLRSTNLPTHLLNKVSPPRFAHSKRISANFFCLKSTLPGTKKLSPKGNCILFSIGEIFVSCFSG